MPQLEGRFRNVLLIGALLAAVAAEILLVPQMTQVILVMGVLSFFQNIAFRLTSRARMRNHAPYHFIASILSSFVWFLMFRTLITSHMSIELFIPYTGGTVLGSLTGAQISMEIERRLGIFADEDMMSKEERQMFERQRVAKRQTHWFSRIWYAPNGKVKLVPFFLVLGILSLVQLASVSLPLGWSLMLLLVAGFSRDMAYGMRTWIQNRNNPQLILGVNVLSAGAEFFVWGGLFNTHMPWSLFLPYTTMSTGGSLFGTFVASYTGKRVGASADAHVKSKVALEQKSETPPFSKVPYFVLGGVIAVQLFFFNPFGMGFVLLVILGSFSRNVAYTLVSRSGNRNHLGYHYVSSLMSNGLYFLTLHWFALKNLDPILSIPFIAASVIGGVLSVEIAMYVERRIGALADAPRPVKAIA